MVLLLFLGFPQEGRTQESPDDVSGQPRPWLFGSAATFSQPIFTDRPTFSLGPSTMPQGRVQMETGYTFSFENAHPNIRTHTVPEALWRFGLVEKIELRLEWPTVTVVNVNNGKSSHGLRDLAVGVKAEVFPQAGLLPQLSLAGRLSIPTGDKAFSSHRLDPEFRTILA